MMNAKGAAVNAPHAGFANACDATWRSPSLVGSECKTDSERAQPRGRSAGIGRGRVGAAPRR